METTIDICPNEFQRGFQPATSTDTIVWDLDYKGNQIASTLTRKAFICVDCWLEKPPLQWVQKTTSSMKFVGRSLPDGRYDTYYSMVPEGYIIIYIQADKRVKFKAILIQGVGGRDQDKELFSEDALVFAKEIATIDYYNRMHKTKQITP